MGLRDRLRDVLALPYLAERGMDAVALESPWASPNHLVTVTPPDAPMQVTRALAMSVPAVARARRIIVGSIARCPLEARVQGERAEKQPVWLTRTDGVQSPFFRMAWTVDDLLFHGFSLWALDRDYDGAVIRADRVPFHLWDVDQDGNVIVNGKRATDESVCLIPASDEGLLRSASAAIRHAVELNRLAARAADTPAAQVVLKQTGGQPLTGPQISELVNSFAAARRGKNGGIAYASQTIDVVELGKTDAQLLVEGRNAAAVDIARAVGVPAAMIDAASTGSGNITYQNVAARNRELIDYALAPFMAAIAARLGLDDMVPRGWAVAFDLSDLTAEMVGDVDVPDDDRTTPTPDDETTR